MPSTPVERWSEIVDASHDGMALIDLDAHVTDTSERFAEALGTALDGVVGADLYGLFPQLEPRAPEIESRLARGEPFGIEIQRPDRGRGRAWLQITLVPRRRPRGEHVGTIVLLRDVSELRRAQRDRRRAQQRLTAIEAEIRRRVSSDLHDGPVQILAALTLRLATIDQPAGRAEEIRELGRAVDDANRELRGLLGELTAADDDSAASKLVRWSAPLLADSPVDVVAEDRTTSPPDRVTTQALFVFVHEVIEAAQRRTTPRTLHATIRDDPSGYRLDIDVPRSEERGAQNGIVPALIDTASEYASSLGGSLEIAMISPDVRRITARIPPIDLTPTSMPIPVAVGVAPARRRRPVSDRSPGMEAELTRDDWEAIASVSHEGLVEVDRDLVVTFVNESWLGNMRREAGEVVGRALAELFAPDDYDRLMPYIDKVMGGETIRFDWQRRNAVGETRWTSVSASPRGDADGGFAGALLVTVDTTESHVTRNLGEDLVARIERTRRATSDLIARQVRSGPLQRLEEVAGRLRRIVDEVPSGSALQPLADELERSITELGSSLDRIGEPDVSDGDWVRAVHTSVGPLLDAGPTSLTIVDETTERPDADRADLFVRVTREAVANAVLHGRARSIVVTLRASVGSNELQIVDDGRGIDVNALHPAPGHLGLRSMAERAAEQGGTIRIELVPAGGTLVAISVPRAGTVHAH